MNVNAETLFRPLPNASQPSLDLPSDRRADLEAKQARVAAILKDAGCEGLLVLEPENFSWLTTGGMARGILDSAESPAVYYSTEQRWVIASNVDSQRLFDEELDGLGFQLKEWPWHWGRAQLLADLCQGRAIACDRSHGDAKVVGDQLRGPRRTLSLYEQACHLALGQIVTHALEATCRNIRAGETEREVAGQLSHRLMHRGVQSITLSVAADGRSRLYRQGGFTATPIERHAVLTVLARKYGLCAMASRSVSFGPPEASFRQEHDAACKVSATYLASTWPDAVPRQILTTGRRVFQITGFEHEWLLGPQGHLTGRRPVEMNLLPATEDLFEPGWPITWTPSVGAACSCDTFVVTDKGPRPITAPDTKEWPVKRIRIQGADFYRPDILTR